MCWTCARATQSKYVLSSLHFKQLGRQCYSTDSIDGYLALIPASVSKPLVSVSARKGHPMQPTSVRRGEAHHLKELINRKPGCCLVFSPPGFKKNVFQILLHAIRSFPHCQSLLWCLDGSHEFAGRLCSEPPLLSPVTHQPAPIRREMASGLFAARMAALMGQVSGGRVPPARGSAPPKVALPPHNTPSLAEARLCQDPTPPAPSSPLA